MLSRQKQNGRSMIEMLGVLGIMAVITVLSIAAYTMAMRNIKVNNVKSDVATIVQHVRSISNGDYSGFGWDDDPSGCNGNSPKCFRSVFMETGLYNKSVNPFAMTTNKNTPYSIYGLNTQDIDGDGTVDSVAGSNFEIYIVSENESDLKLLAA